MPVAAHAGAWLMPEGKGQLINNFRYYRADKEFDLHNSKDSRDLYQKYEYNPFIEYGLIDELTIGGSISLNQSRDKASGEEAFNVDDINIFGRFSVFEYGPYIVSIEPSLYISIESTADLNNEPTSISPELHLNFGYGTESMYIDVSAGYAARTDALADKAEGDLTIGFNVDEDLQWLNQVSTSLVISGHQDVPGDYNLTKFQTSLVWEQDENINHQIGISYDVIGTLTGAGYGFLYSIWYKF